VGANLSATAIFYLIIVMIIMEITSSGSENIASKKMLLYARKKLFTLFVVRAEQVVKLAGWDPNGFWGVRVRWGSGWLKSTRGGVSF
jgi:hypothetical protein